MNLLSTIHSFIELASVDSTNNYAMGQAHAGLATQGTLVFAHEQLAGKGQRGRSWTSDPGRNIVMSLVLEPVFLPVTQQFPLSAAVALGCHDFFCRYAGQEETAIKWPNDLYWRDRKAGGILIENIFKGNQWAFAIVGIGININQVEFTSTARNPVSLRQITGRTFDAVQLARELGERVLARYDALMQEPGAIGTGAKESPGMKESAGTEVGGRAKENAGTEESAGTKVGGGAKEGAGAGEEGAGEERANPGNGGNGLMEQYNASLYKRGQAVRLKKDNAVFETSVQGVSPRGTLLTRDTLDREFSFGEVEWVI